MNRFKFIRSWSWAVALSTCACSTDNAPSGNASTESKASEGTSPADTRICAAIRGNGHYGFAHFGALARLTEAYGEFDAVAGGSSASVSAFLYTSIAANPSLSAIEHQRRAELALLLKSIMGYVDVVATGEEAQGLSALNGASTAVQRLLNELETKGLEGYLRDLQGLAGVPQTAAEIERALMSAIDRRYHTLVNPNVWAMLADQDSFGYRDYSYKIGELREAAGVIGSFDPNDREMFFREGLVNFEGLAEQLGVIANFYAGTHEASAGLLRSFLDACADVTVGQTWREIDGTWTEYGTTCGDEFRSALASYREWKRLGGQTPAGSDRLNATLDGPVKAFVPVAVLASREGVARYREARSAYRSGESNVNLGLDFERDVRFGYLVPESNWDAVENLATVFSEDARSALSIRLNDRLPGQPRGVTWRTALASSPVEPGLSKILDVEDDLGLIGGWADLSPTKILSANGCDEVVLINRRGAESGFLVQQRPLNDIPSEERDAARAGVAELLGLTGELQSSIFAAANPNSSANTAVSEASAVWCTDWNEAGTIGGSFNPTGLFEHAYGTARSSRGAHSGIAFTQETFRVSHGLSGLTEITKQDSPPELDGCFPR